MKKYITWMIVTLLILDTASVVAQANKKPLYTAAFGVQAYTFRRSFPIDVAKTLDTIKMMGFTEIEGTGGNISTGSRISKREIRCSEYNYGTKRYKHFTQVDFCR